MALPFRHFHRFAWLAVALALTAAAALVTARYANRAARWVHTLSVLLMAVPGLVLGLSFVLAFKGTALYGTVWILILAGVLHFFTTPYNLLYQSLQKLKRIHVCPNPQPYAQRDQLQPSARPGHSDWTSQG